MNFKKKTLMLLAFVLIAIAVVGNGVLYVYGVSPFNLYEIDERHVLPGESIQEIQIMSPVGNVNVIQHEAADIVVELRGKTERHRADAVRLHLTDHHGRLVVEIEQVQRQRLISFYGGHYELLVSLPPKLFEQLTIEANVADVTVSGVEAKSVQIWVNVGQITVNDVQGRIQGKTEVGDIELILQSVEHDIEAMSKVGEIMLRMKQAPPALSWDLNSTVGKQTVNLPATTDRRGGEGVPMVTLRAEVGDITLTAEDGR